MWKSWRQAILCVALASCSEPAASGGAPAADAQAGADAAPGEVVGTDGGATADAAPDATTADTAQDAVSIDGGDGVNDPGDAAPDAGVEAGPAADVAPDAAPDVAVADVPDWDGLLDPPDTGADTAVDVGAPGPGKGLGTLYAHTATALYRLEQSGFVFVGNFGYDKNFGEMTDIALDKDGNLYGVTFYDAFACDKKTAQCKWLASLPQTFNGLTFVPEGTVKPNDEALIGIANSGTWNLIEVSGTSATIQPLGSYGGYGSSGDAFSVKNVGTYATVTGGFGGDKLALVDPATGKVKKIIGDTGAYGLWGLAWFQDVFYGFSSNGKVYAIDVTTGQATAVTGMSVPGGVEWWGAGVSTRAAGD